MLRFCPQYFREFCCRPCPHKASRSTLNQPV
jgi:hypothetical protein